MTGSAARRSARTHRANSAADAAASAATSGESHAYRVPAQLVSSVKQVTAAPRRAIPG